jgi:hypothetical protein
MRGPMTQSGNGGGSPGFRKGYIRDTDFSNFKRPIIVIASEAKQSIFLRMEEESWIASSQVLPCANALRLSQAMTL